MGGNRWITPFRRRVGRWLTPAESFVALLTYSRTADYDKPYYCNFTFGTGTNEPWVSTINLLAKRTSQQPTVKLQADSYWPGKDRHKLSLPDLTHFAHGEHHASSEWDDQRTRYIAPRHVQYLYSGGNWDVNYTYTPIQFQPPNGTVKTELVTIITGHGTSAPRMIDKFETWGSSGVPPCSAWWWSW
jgi:hypothetical protein